RRWSRVGARSGRRARSPRRTHDDGGIACPASGASCASRGWCAPAWPPPERFGFRFEAATRLFLVTSLMHRRYFRVECHGIAALPRGPVMLVANHGSHALAWDGAMILTACLLDADPPRLVHGMAEHRLMELPIIGRAARRIGAVDGRRD